MRKLIVLAAVVALVVFAVGWHRAAAQALDPPAKMSREEAQELRGDMLQLADLQRQAAPLEARVRAKQQRYHFDLAHGDAVNSETGEIARKAVPK